MIRNIAVMVVLSAVFALPALAEDKGQGFIVTAEQATVYKNAESDETIGTLAKGEAVAGFRGFYDPGRNNFWVASEKNDRLWIMYLKANVKGNPVPTPGWVRKADLISFSYECGCGPKTQGLSDKGDVCSPTQQQGKFANASFSWNLCFSDARDTKALALKAAEPKPAATAATATTPLSVEERLAKLEELFKKGLLSKEEYEKKRAEILSSL